jgi:hypothetical protein
MSTSIKLTRLRPLKRTDLFPIVANLLPVFGVGFLGWSPIEAFIVYALETLIVGVLTVLKMLTLTFSISGRSAAKQAELFPVHGLFLILFFIFHYGMFAGIQTSIFAGVSGIGPKGSSPLYFFLNWYHFVNSDIAFMLSAFVVSYVANNFIPFVISGEYRNGSIIKLMFQPYGRIVVQQLTVIVGSMFLSFGLGLGFMIVFVAVKLYFDLFVNFDAYIESAMVEAKLKQEKNQST